MAWSSSLTDAILLSKTRSKTRRYITRVTDGLRKYSEQTFWTTVEEYRSLTQAVADSEAESMASDTVDGTYPYLNRTVVTAEVHRQNDADAYKIVKTTAYTSAWTAWTEYA